MKVYCADCGIAFELDKETEEETEMGIDTSSLLCEDCQIFEEILD